MLLGVAGQGLGKLGSMEGTGNYGNRQTVMVIVRHNFPSGYRSQGRGREVLSLAQKRKVVASDETNGQK